MKGRLGPTDEQTDKPTLIRRQRLCINFFFLPINRQFQATLCRSVGQSVTLSFFDVYGRFWGYSSCLTALLVYFITAPAYPHATWVAVYPALFLLEMEASSGSQKWLRIHSSVKKAIVHFGVSVDTIFVASHYLSLPYCNIGFLHISSSK